MNKNEHIYNRVWKIIHIISFAIIILFGASKCFALGHPLDVHVVTPEEEEMIKESLRPLKEKIDEWKEERREKTTEEFIEENKPKRNEEGGIIYEE